MTTPERADSLTGKVDKLFANFDRPGSPGCALGIIKDGQFVYSRGYGSANLDYDIPLSADSVFYIASTSKQFTAASVVLLAQQGKVSLDDNIRKYLPEIPDYGTPITIRHLLHHISGIRDYLALWDLAGERYEDVHSTADAIAIIGRQKKLNFNPGEEWLYSNSGYLLLAEIVKRASGRSLKEFAQENIFGPLGMTNTHFHDDRSVIVKNRVISYLIGPKGEFRTHTSNFELVGDGGLMTSVTDLGKWDRNFYEPLVGGRELVSQMQTPGKLSSGQVLDYAFALRIGKYKGLRTISHGGSLAGYRTELLRFPDQRFSVICLCNVENANPPRLAAQVADIYLAEGMQKSAGTNATAERQFIEISEKELAAKAGSYLDESTHQVLGISSRGGLLVVDGAGQPLRVGAVSPTEFRPVDPSQDIILRFEPLENKSGSRITVMAGTQKPVTYVPYHAVALNASQLREYAGAYYSRELETTYSFFEKSGKLVLKRKNGTELELDPVIKDVFRARGLTIEFARDKKGAISQLSLNAGRVRGLQFRKQNVIS